MRKFLEVFIFSMIIGILFVTSSAKATDVIYLLKNGMTTLTGASVRVVSNNPTKLIQVDMSGASALSATTVLQGSLNASTWTTISSVNVEASGVAYFVPVTSPYPYIRANITAISGIYGSGGIASAITANTYSRVNVLLAE